MFPVGIEVFVGKDKVVIIGSLSKITEIETFMNKGIEEEIQKNNAGEATILNKDELKFLARI